MSTQKTIQVGLFCFVKKNVSVFYIDKKDMTKFVVYAGNIQFITPCEDEEICRSVFESFKEQMEDEI